MSKWRPAGYKNPYVPNPKVFNRVLSESEIKERYKMERKPIDAYEAGFDAAVEALRKSAGRITIHHGICGNWVFIPEDTED